MKISLSCIIPSYKDPYSQKTIKSILENTGLGDGIEIIQVLDSYWPTFELTEDPRVRYVHLGANRGMRGAINAGVRVARGEYLARFDEHIKVCKNWDKILIDSCQPNWIMTGKRFYLDPEKWEYMDKKPVECEKLVIQNCGEGVRKFSGQRWDNPNKEALVEGYGMQGSFWLMPHKWWDSVISELRTEGYGPAYQDSTEMCMKTWKAGGKLMWNRDMNYAHKHRSFSRTHQEGSKENPWKREESWKYALDIWEDYYTNELLPKWKQV